MTGTYAYDDLKALVERGGVASDSGIADDQLQPASIDLSLSAEAYRMPGSVLALAGERVRDLIGDLALERLSLSNPVCLARGQVYLVRLRERFAFAADEEGYTNSKSSTGRIDLATRVVADGSPRYDRLPAGYHGEVWLEVIPRSFDVVVRSGDSLNQAIVFHNRNVLDHAEMVASHQRDAFLFDADGQPVDSDRCLFDGRVVMTADLSTTVVGYVAKRSQRPVDIANIGRHQADDYFMPLNRPPSGLLFLEKDNFYILATHERVRVPLTMACEMVPYDPAAGEFRAHYAGFFDPGWGVHDHGAQGARAVLEVRPHEDDLILRHGQPICAMAYEMLTAACSQPYGGSGSNYAMQDGPTLSKHFAR